MELPHTNLILLLITSLLFLTNSGAVAAISGNETDRLALLAFKGAITSDPLNSLRSWNSSFHFCQWQGVVCGRRHQRVIHLNLQARNLVGSIPPHTGNLTFLRELLLSSNTFGGVIPQEIGRLSRLRYLDLSLNSIVGGIPINLSYCSELNYVNLVGNHLAGKIPPELGSLSKLSALGLGNNSLTGSIPPSLGNLSSLVRLSLARNYLEDGIPDDLGRLTSLGFFQASANNLSGLVHPSLFNVSTIYYFAASDNKLEGSLPQNLGLSLPKLQAIYAGENQFSGSIPSSLANASGLTVVELISNNLVGSVPENLGTLKGLVRLNLAFNQLGTSIGNDLGFITALTNCSSLQTLALHGNQLRGPLPSSLVNLSAVLNMLSLGGNMISGSIPMGIENLVNLTLLGVEENLLVGAIPSTMGNLGQLQLLALDQNKLSGEIPSSLGNMTSLTQLWLQENDLGGVIPWSLGQCPRLQLLNLSHNRLEGAIPPQLFSLSSLSISLNLAHNSLSGTLQAEIGNLESLGELIVSHNRLGGTIPMKLGECVSLERLYMDGNSFEGAIPSSLGNLKGLQEIDLSRNNLTGQIPEYLGRFQYLRYLNLSYNDLNGQVPLEGVFTNPSSIALLGNSQLCGGMPTLKLPTCSTRASSGGGRYRHVKLIALILGLVLPLTVSMALLLVLWVRKKSKGKPPSASSKEADKYKKVSYSELFRATDGFSLSNLVGVGSYGSVYKGQLDQDQALLAVKVLNLEQRGASRSFVNECKVLRNVRHRNLVKIITLCSSVDHKGDDFKALVFEFMKNGNLDGWLHPEGEAQGPPKCLDLLQRLDIAIDVASALDYLHHHGPAPIVHCDLKPSNVLLDDHMTARVGDFGLARFLSKTIMSTDASIGDQTSTMCIKGTIGYVPPEYGLAGEPSREGDVYSYGVLLLEMFTGRRPTDRIFEGYLDLRKFAESAFPRRVVDIVDPSLLVRTGADVRSEGIETRKTEDCLVTVVGTGLSCCAHVPQERPEIGDVVVELHGARETLLRKANRGGR